MNTFPFKIHNISIFKMHRIYVFFKINLLIYVRLPVTDATEKWSEISIIPAEWLQSSY